jgi:hypothetical protein
MPVREEGSVSPSKLIIGYGTMIGGTVAAALFLRSYGAGLVAPLAEHVESAAAATPPASETLMHVLLALTVVILAARAFGAAFRFIQQPPVIGEVIAGIALGPSLLGQIAPGVSQFLLPTTVAPFPFSHRPGRRHPLHVPGRSRTRHELHPAARARYGRHLPSEHHFPLPAWLDDGSLALSDPLVERRTLHDVRVIPRCLSLGDRVSRARAHPYRSRHARDPHSAPKSCVRPTRWFTRGGLCQPCPHGSRHSTTPEIFGVNVPRARRCARGRPPAFAVRQPRSPDR